MCLCDHESPVGNVTHSMIPNLNSGLVPIDPVGLVPTLYQTFFHKRILCNVSRTNQLRFTTQTILSFISPVPLFLVFLKDQVVLCTVCISISYHIIRMSNSILSIPRLFSQQYIETSILFPGPHGKMLYFRILKISFLPKV